MGRGGEAEELGEEGNVEGDDVLRHDTTLSGTPATADGGSRVVVLLKTHAGSVRRLELRGKLEKLTFWYLPSM